MPDNNDKKSENITSNKTPKKHSFFGGEINENTKNLLDFRYNTQEQIDRLNEEMTTTDDLDEIMKQANNGINIDRKDKVFNEENKDESELDLKQNPESHDKADIIDDKNNKRNHAKKDEPIEGEVIEHPNFDENPKNIKNNTTDKGINIPEDTNNTTNKIKEGNIGFNTDDSSVHDNEPERDDEGKNNTNKKEEKVTSEESPQSEIKFFDPFELNFDSEDTEENDKNENKEIGEPDDPFGLNGINDKIDNKAEEKINNKVNVKKINDENTEEVNDENIEETNIENVEETNDENVEETNDENVEETNDENVEETNDENVEETNDENVEETNDGNVEQVEVYKDSKNDEKSTENDDEYAIKTIPDNQNQKNGKEKTIKDKKIKKNSATGEIITNKEIELEQGQDMPSAENDEEHQISAEEIFEQEPEFFADDELSQQFMQLVQNVRKIFKIEHKNDENINHFKVLGGKTEDLTTEYLFYLIEEKDEPIDLYIKKVEVNRENEQENEHLLQFSYNENKELNIFVDEIILYERINGYNSDTPEYNDTKTILEKFIFLTENHYDKIKSELENQRKEMQKKRQLQQIFKGF